MLTTPYLSSWIFIPEVFKKNLCFVILKYIEFNYQLHRSTCSHLNKVKFKETTVSKESLLVNEKPFVFNNLPSTHTTPLPEQFCLLTRR